jgi:hypothetical protein
MGCMLECQSEEVDKRGAKFGEVFLASSTCLGFTKACEERVWDDGRAWFGKL